MKKFIYSFVLSFFTFFTFAEEGMLIPSLIAAFQSDMKAKGMKLTAEQIYSINNSSLKDAIIHFGGGCTAEIISNQGLILTNHHCGYYQIQQHSSLENDYLKNGFWAKNLNEELPNAGLTASRIVSIEDVSIMVLFGTENIANKDEKQRKISENIQQIIKDKTTNSHYTVEIQDFDYGNSYYSMTSEVFQDIRLVGTPPNSIGKFGGDTDNWVWPRHTGDFSVFRIYTGPDNKPAPYSKNNVPYKPLFSLTIDAGKKKNGDFTMVYGFPGMTEQHLVSGQLKFIIDKVRPAQISMREKSLSIIDSRMRANDEIRIKYAAKQASIANSYKKWIGQIQGLKELRAVDVKHNYEANYTQTALQNEAWRDSYGTVVERMNMLFEQNKAIEFSNALYIEYLFVGPEFFKQVRVMDDLLKNYEKYEKSGDLKNRIDKNKKAVEKFFKDYSKEVDQTIFYLLHSEFLSQMEKSYLPDVIYSKSTEEWSRGIYEKSIFTDKQRLLDFYTKLSSKSIKKIKKDQGYILFTSLINKYRGDILPKLQDFQIGMEELLKTYVAGKQIMFPNEKHWPDANSTLRITYGKLEGSSPKDGMMYEDHTTIDGIIEKNKSGNPDFELLPRMFDLYNKKEFGPYAQDNELWVCFSASNHTTGGNSGSPVLNENGQLIGINFDRTWESTMSDYMFDPSRCRNVVCDIRYVLWVIDIYSNANHLIKEMNIIRD
jgi:hypothetical protein